MGGEEYMISTCLVSEAQDAVAMTPNEDEPTRTNQPANVFVNECFLRVVTFLGEFAGICSLRRDESLRHGVLDMKIAAE